MSVRRPWPLLVALVLLGPLLGACRGGPALHGPVPVGSSTWHLRHGGVQRTYHLYRPAKLADPAPLVVFLHGGFGSGTQAERDYHWDARADTSGFLVLYPDGLARAWDTGGGCCGLPGRLGVDDVGFVRAAVAAVEAAVPVDRARVYATGISNGGILAYTLACRTTLLAAIGPDAATQLGDCPHPAPLSVIHVHGTADRNIPYLGGRGDGVAHLDGPAVPALVAAWRRTDGCGPPSTTTVGAVTTSVATCPGGRAVELVTVAGAGHQWPGAVGHPLAQRLLGTDPPSQALDATAVIWAFFAAHPQPRA